MATPHACAALVDVFPDVLRLKRAVATIASTTPSTALLAAVRELQHPRVSELAEHLHLDMSTVSRQVTHLRQRHLLRASPDPADGRSQRLSVTEEGMAELRRWRGAMVAELVQRLQDWHDVDVDTLTSMLSRLSRGGEAVTHPLDPPLTSTGTPASPATGVRAAAAPTPQTSTPQMQENA
jgi:DNA-binding MarR family transcriptional regulator